MVPNQLRTPPESYFGTVAIYLRNNAFLPYPSSNLIRLLLQFFPTRPFVIQFQLKKQPNKLILDATPASIDL
jgi:hypothetical protein